jgi:hypothetical protein
MVAKQAPPYTLKIEAPANARVGKSTVRVVDRAGKTVYTDRANLSDAAERRKLANRAAEKLKRDPDKLLEALEQKWHETIDEYRRYQDQARAGSSEGATDSVRLLDAPPPTISRPLCLVGGCAYAAAWVPLEHTVSQTVIHGIVQKHDPPLVTVEDALLVVTEDGRLYSDRAVPDALPLAELGLPVRLPFPVTPGRGWSGLGVRRYRAGERPDPAEVFARLVSVADTFLDFARSLADQRTMCQLLACFVLASWLLDAFHVAGYLWANGEAGAGKTSCLQVVTETAYLGQLILATSSYPTLRDLADYGACLGFDDAEMVMDPRRTDPDKRTLLLAGNRRGATVAVKEQTADKVWVTRYVNAYCPRLFSAIRSPDPVLGSRAILLPMVRSGDPRKTKLSVMDPADWPCDRDRLRDDLWALALANLAQMPEQDRAAAARASLAGRPLEPWRGILGVAHWLEERAGVADLFDRMEALSVKYQGERSDYEEHDSTRVLFRALLQLAAKERPGVPFFIKPGEVAAVMNQIARDDSLAEEDKPYTTARSVGWLLKRQRFRRGDRDSKAKTWEVLREEIEAAARAHGVQPEAGAGAAKA